METYLINSKIRAKLRSLAHHIKPCVFIGKSGLTDGVVQSIKEYLDKDELIKVKFNSYKKDKNDLIEKSLKTLSAYIIGSIGHTIIIYKPSEDVENRKYKF